MEIVEFTSPESVFKYQLRPAFLKGEEPMGVLFLYGFKDGPRRDFVSAIESILGEYDQFVASPIKKGSVFNDLHDHIVLLIFGGLALDEVYSVDAVLDLKANAREWTKEPYFFGDD